MVNVNVTGLYMYGLHFLSFSNVFLLLIKWFVVRPCYTNSSHIHLIFTKFLAGIIFSDTWVYLVIVQIQYDVHSMMKLSNGIRPKMFPSQWVVQTVVIWPWKYLLYHSLMWNWQHCRPPLPPSSCTHTLHWGENLGNIKLKIGY